MISADLAEEYDIDEIMIAIPSATRADGAGDCLISAARPAAS